MAWRQVDLSLTGKFLIGIPLMNLEFAEDFFSSSWEGFTHCFTTSLFEFSRIWVVHHDLSFYWRPWIWTYWRGKVKGDLISVSVGEINNFSALSRLCQIKALIILGPTIVVKTIMLYLKVNSMVLCIRLMRKFS